MTPPPLSDAEMDRIVALANRIIRAPAGFADTEGRLLARDVLPLVEEVRRLRRQVESLEDEIRERAELAEMSDD